MFILNLSSNYEPATPSLTITHLHITEHILFFDLQGEWTELNVLFLLPILNILLFHYWE